MHPPQCALRACLASRWLTPGRPGSRIGLKKECIKKRVYNTRDMATINVSAYIESFYNSRRRHSHIGGVSPEDFETAAKRR
jgi:transposase InsO family protein